jgi:glycosyltransferase involved in cell wall biosynthesis
MVPVSVIICARNEEDNIFKNLPIILEQDYPEFEVIIVNDQSVDDSRHIIKAYQEKYKYLKLIELERNRHRKFGKKVPLTIGIKGAKYDHLVLIDADCYPNSSAWLKQMMQHYTGQKEVVIGYGPYQKRKGFLNKIVRFDTTAIAATYLSFAISGRPYMGVGRNMSYKKARFFEVEGFKKHYHIQSGDDDLFIQDAATRKNVAVALNPESFVYSEPKEKWKEWIKQKQRHYTTATNYKLINKLFLGIFPSTMFLMLFSFFILLFNSEWYLFIGVLLAVRFLLYWLINGFLFKRLQMGDLVWYYPLFELIHFFMMPFIYYSAERREPNKW